MIVHSTVQFRTLQFYAIQVIAVQFFQRSAVQHTYMQYSTVQFSIVHCSTMHCSAIQFSAVSLKNGHFSLKNKAQKEYWSIICPSASCVRPLLSHSSTDPWLVSAASHLSRSISSRLEGGLNVARLDQDFLLMMSCSKYRSARESDRSQLSSWPCNTDQRQMRRWSCVRGKCIWNFTVYFIYKPNSLMIHCTCIEWKHVCCVHMFTYGGIGGHVIFRALHRVDQLVCS